MQNQPFICYNETNNLKGMVGMNENIKNLLKDNAVTFGSQLLKLAGETLIKMANDLLVSSVKTDRKDLYIIDKAEHHFKQ